MTDKAEDIIQLKLLCAELKIDPRDARQKLRLAIKDQKKYPELAKSYEPRQPWQWARDSLAHKEALKAITC